MPAVARDKERLMTTIRLVSARRVTLMLAVSSLAGGMAAMAGIAPSPFRPASLVSRNLTMHNGQPFVRLADVAKALGGSLRYEARTQRFEIQPGAGGVVQVNLAALGSVAGGPPVASPRATDRNAFRLAIGGREIPIGEEDRVLVSPSEPALSLRFLARLLGGQATFDPGKGVWMLPAGGPATPLRFR